MLLCCSKREKEIERQDSGKWSFKEKSHKFHNTFDKPESAAYHAMALQSLLSCHVKTHRKKRVGFATPKLQKADLSKQNRKPALCAGYLTHSNETMGKVLFSTQSVKALSQKEVINDLKKSLMFLLKSFCIRFCFSYLGQIYFERFLRAMGKSIKSLHYTS